MCGKTNLSIKEGDGGQECQLTDGRWVCTPDCWDRAVDGSDLTYRLREALIQADLTIRSIPGKDQSDVEFIRVALGEIPAPILQVTDEMVLAACRTIYPNLFAHGLGPKIGDGPATRSQIAETTQQQRKALEAALAAQASEVGQPTSVSPSDIYVILKRYHDQDRFTWHCASALSRDIAALFPSSPPAREEVDGIQ
jgi:hypothetical protein